MVKNPISIVRISEAIMLIAIFVSSLYVPLDPDLGWHLKYGEHFFKTGEILRDNPFTTLMPDYKWNNSSWATDLLSYQIFKNFGFLGLSVLGAMVITLTFFFIGKAAKLSIFEKSIIFPLVLYFVSPVNQVSFRGQLISLLFIAVMFYFLSKYQGGNKKIALFLLPLFALWSNFHGQFIFGLALFLIWTFVFCAKEIYLNYRDSIGKFFTQHKLLLLTFFGSFVAVLINPFGAGVYIEAIGHYDDPLQKSITEFLSFSDFSTLWWHQLIAGLILTIGVALLGTGKKNLDKAPFYVPSFILFVFSFWIRRYAWPFYYTSIFLMQPVVAFFKPDKEKHAKLAAFTIASLFLVFVVGLRYPFTDLREMSWDNYCKASIGCSPTAAKTVIEKKLNSEKLLTIYDYGGWLIWNYPEIKPTIDGRMHLWRNESGYSAFSYYYPIEQNTTGDIDKTPYNAVLTSKRKPIYQRLVELAEQGKWKPIHIDKYSAVFVRNSSKNN